MRGESANRRIGTRRPQQQRGVSLVEIAILIVVIGILSLVLLSAMTAQQVAIERNAVRRAAIGVCQSHVDRSLATPYDALFSIRNNSAANFFEDEVDGVIFQSTRVMIERTHTNNQKYMDISVTTAYPTSGADPVQMATILSKTEP